jgi:hypothetical protein
MATDALASGDTEHLTRIPSPATFARGKGRYQSQNRPSGGAGTEGRLGKCHGRLRHETAPSRLTSTRLACRCPCRIAFHHKTREYLRAYEDAQELGGHADARTTRLYIRKAHNIAQAEVERVQL